jgi:hypothetical protein
MTNRTRRTPISALGALCTALAASTLLSACIVQPLPQPAPRYYPQPVPPAPRYYPAQPVPVQEPVYGPEDAVEPDEPVVSVYVDPPTYQPEPIAVAWAPPPMLVEAPPPQPYYGAIWTGGYWVWQGRWVWAAGRWSAPPQPDFLWVQPYYEHRGDVVIFVPGFWCPPQRHFVPPPPGLSINVTVGIGGFVGHRPSGPQGSFVPPPPGSRQGLIVPAPIGTPPAVVMSAPPVLRPGMRVRGNPDFGSRPDNRPANVTIEAPQGTTANGQAFNGTVPGRANLAASLPPQVHANAPVPNSGQAIPSYVPGRPPAALPAAQPVRGDRGDRGGYANGGGQRPGMQQQPQQQNQAQQPGQPQRPGANAEFAPPPRQPAQIDNLQRPGQQDQQNAQGYAQQGVNQNDPRGRDPSQRGTPGGQRGQPQQQQQQQQQPQQAQQPGQPQAQQPGQPQRGQQPQAQAQAQGQGQQNAAPGNDKAKAEKEHGRKKGEDKDREKKDRENER